MVIGLISLLGVMRFRKEENLYFEGVMMVASTIFILILSLFGGIDFLSGIGMVGGITIFSYAVIKRGGKRGADKKEGSKIRQGAICVVLLLCVVVAGKFTVDFAIRVATLAGVSEWIIGASVIALGTSLPEIIISLVAAGKHKIEMSVGNIVGSNIFNLMWVLGFAALLNPVRIEFAKIWMDLFIMLILTMMFFVGIIKKHIGRVEGAAYVGIYILFIIHLLGWF